MGKKKSGTSLGKAIIRDRFGKKNNKVVGDSFVSLVFRPYLKHRGSSHGHKESDFKESTNGSIKGGLRTFVYKKIK